MKKGEWCEIYKGNEAVRCLALQEASVSLPFFLSVDHDMSEFLVALESAVVQSECEFDVKWLIHCFAARFACSSHVFLNSFVKRCLNWFDEPPAKLLLNFLFENNELPQMDDPVALYFCNALFKFAHRHPVLLRCMPEIERLVQAIGNERLLKFLGIYAFAFYFDSEGIREHLAIQDLNTEEVQMILMSNCRLCVWEAVQDAHFRVYQYPNDFPDAFSPALCSLTSSSIVKKKHFFDVVAGAVKKCLIDVNLDAIPMFVRTCPVVVPYLIIAYQSIVYCDPLKYTRLINASIPDLALNDIMEGFRNDIKLVKALYPEGDLEIPMEYVESHSIPFLFIEKLGDHSVIELTQKKYYIYDELETSRDRDFILGLHVLVGFLDLIKMEKLTSRAVKEIGTRAKECLSAIEDPAVLNHLCIDLFSIIFLRNVQGRFVCHASIARRIIKLVNMFNPTVYVKRAISCLFSQEIRKVSCDLKDYGTSILCDFLDKLEHRNFDIAGTYTSLEPQFRKIYIISRSMNELELKGASLAECALYKHELNVECGMTGLHPSDCLRYAMDTASDELVKLAIGNRLNSDPDRWLNPVGSKEWESSGPIAQNLDLFPTDFLATRQFRRFKPVLSKSLLDFVQYLDMYYRCRLLYFHVERKRPLNVLSFDVLSALQGPFNTGDYQKAQEVAECFGVDLFPYVLEHPQKFRIKKKTLKHFRNRYPLECWTLLLDEKKVNFLDPTGLTGILKKYWRTTKKYRSLQSRLHKSNSWSDLLEALNTTEIAPQNSITELPKLDEPISVEEAFPKKSFSTLHLHDQDAKDGNGKQWLFQPEDVAPSSTKTEKKVVIAGAELGKPQPFIHRRRQSVGWGENIKRIPMKPCRIESDSRCDLHRHFQMQIPIEKNPAVVLRPNSTGDLSKIDMQNGELQLEKGFLEMLQNPETDPRDLDDYVYRINPTRCCTITIQNLDTIPDFLAGYVFDACGYSTNLSRNRAVHAILVRRQIEKVTSAGDDDDSIVGELVVLREYKLAAEYIRLFAQEKEMLVVKYVRQLLSNTHELRNFMMALPDFFEVIASDVDEAIPIMADFCPDSIRPAFLAFESLPIEVRVVSSLVDRSTIAKAFCSGRIDLVRYLRRQHLVLFSDEDLTAVLAESARTCIFKYFAKDAIHLSSLVRNKTLFVDICSDRVQREIDCIKVTCIEDEFQASLLTDKILAFSKFCPLREQVARMLHNVVKFIDHKPFSRTHIPYGFHSASLQNICFDLDLDDLAFEFDAVDKESYIRNRVRTELYLGRFDDANDFLAQHQYCFNDVSIQYLQPFLHKEVFYYEGIDMMIMNGIDCFKFRGEPAQMPFYRMIVASCKKMKKALHIGEFHTFLDRWCGVRPRLEYYTRFGEISRTVDILKTVPEDAGSSVIPMMLATAVGFKYEVRLMKEIARCDRGGTLTEWIWKSITHYLSSRNMNYFLSEVYLAHGQLEDLARVSYNLCKESQLITAKLFHIANAVNAIMESEKHRNGEASGGDIKSSNMTEEERKAMRDVLQLLYDVYNFFYQQRIVKLTTDPINDPDGILLMGAILVELKNEELLQRLVSTFQVSKAKIVSYFFDKMSDREPQEVIDYVDTTKSDKGFWGRYHHEFVRSLACSKNSSIISIVIHDICPQSQVIGLLLECDRLKEAYTFAVSKNDLDLLPLIAFHASQLGDMDVVAFCEKNLNKT